MVKGKMVELQVVEDSDGEDRKLIRLSCALTRQIKFRVYPRICPPWHNGSIRREDVSSL